MELRTTAYRFFGAFLGLLSLSAANAINYTDNGSNTNYSLFAGDTLRVLSGNYTGRLNSFSANAVVLVSSGANFKPQSISMAAGRIINQGYTKFAFFLGTYEGFSVLNYGTAEFMNTISLYDGFSADQELINFAGGTMSLNGSVTLGARGSLVNKGTMTVSNNLTLYTASSSLVNEGRLTVNGTLSQNAGTLINRNVITPATFTYYGGTLTNEGGLYPQSTFTISSSQTFTNKCRLVTQGGLTNYGTLENSGLIWVGRSNTASDELLNSGTIRNSGAARIKTVKLTNYGTFTGSGSLFISGESLTSGVVGAGGTTTDTLRIFDSTRASASRIFDTQWGTVHPNAIFATVQRLDTLVVLPGCSNIFRSVSGAPLPVQFTYFYARMEQKPVLLWSAEFEPGMRFTIERSYDGRSFMPVAEKISTSERAYSFTDLSADLSKGTIYYRIKGESAVDGAVKYTPVRLIKTSGTQKAFTLTRGGSKGPVTIQYHAPEHRALMVRITTAGGQQVFLRTLVANAGNNGLVISETTSLAAGLYIIDLVAGNELLGSEKLVIQ